MKCSRPNCYHDAVPGSDECRRHADEAARVRKYRLTNRKLADRMSEMDSVDYLASLEQEVKLAHVMLEERLNAVGDNPAEIIAAHNAVMSSLETINRLVTNLHKQNLQTGEVLAKPALHRLLSQAIEIIADELEAFVDHPKYSGTIDRIDEKIADLVQNARNEDERP